MMVRIQPLHPAGTGRPLTTYILAVKREHDGDGHASYVPDPDKDKAEWGRTVNLGTNDPVHAIDLIEVYNATNFRKHSKSRFEHIIISFPNGERPTDQQIEHIEDRLMAAIGWAKHPRISALHHDTDNWHHHVAVTRIDPVTLKADHPPFTRRRFQLEAARLELDLGLRQERKTLLARERREIDSRIALERELNHRIAIDGTIVMFPKEDQMAGSEPLTTIEFSRLEAQELLTRHQLAERLGGAPVTPGVSQSISDKLSAAAGPALSDIPVQITSMTLPVQLTRSELFSLILTQEFTTHGYPSQRPSYQDRLNEKLTRAEERIVEHQQKALDAKGFIRGTLNRLFGHEAASKEAVRDADPRLTAFDDIKNQRSYERGQQHAANRREHVLNMQRQDRGATPADALYARYKTERAVAEGHRKEAEQAVYDRFAAYQHGLSAHYTVRYEQEKLNPRQRHHVERQQNRELLKAEQRGDRVQAQQMRVQQLAAARREHPLPTWDKFLERESQRGDREAARLLQQERARHRQQQHGYER